MNIIEKAIEDFKQGKNVVIPTETVYGLGASIYQEKALKNIFSLKNRPSDNPLIVHIHCLEEVIKLAREIPKEFYLLAEAFFPGPLTVILKKKKGLSHLITAGLDTVAIRMPKHPIAKKILKGLGEPVAAPSANLSGKPSPTTKEHVKSDFGDAVLVVDGGACEIGIESTVISLVDTPKIFRPGSITKSELERVLGCSVSETKETTKPVCPGMKYRHYAPNATVTIFQDKQDLQKNSDSNCMVLSNEEILGRDALPYSSATIYSLFREADSNKMKSISIYLDSNTKNDSGLVNRLEKASKG